MNRKTKIVCTLGPATDGDGILRQMLEAGMNVARFNFSHGSHEEHKRRLDALKALRQELDLPVAAMLDTKGPEVRLKSFAGGKVSISAKCCRSRANSAWLVESKSPIATAGVIPHFRSRLAPWSTAIQVSAWRARTTSWGTSPTGPPTNKLTRINASSSLENILKCFDYEAETASKVRLRNFRGR